MLPHDLAALLALLTLVSECQQHCAGSVEVSPLCYSSPYPRQLSPEDSEFFEDKNQSFIAFVLYTYVDAEWYSTYTWRMVIT